MATLSLVLLLLSVQWSWAQEDPLLPFSEHLDLEHKVRLKWGFDEIQGTVLFELTVNTSGWVSFGFSPKGGMTGADIVIGGVGPKGSYFTVKTETDNWSLAVKLQLIIFFWYFDLYILYSASYVFHSVGLIWILITGFHCEIIYKFDILIQFERVDQAILH